MFDRRCFKIFLNEFQHSVECMGWILDFTKFCINGQQAIDVAKNEIDRALLNLDKDQTIKPVPLMLLDF